MIFPPEPKYCCLSKLKMEKYDQHDTSHRDDWRYEFRGVENEYVRVGICGKGTYGCVYKVYKRKNPKRFYAVKKIEPAQEKDGFNLTTVREIGFLSRLNHPNVMSLKEVFCSKPSRHNGFKRSVFLVMEYMEHDLHAIMSHERFKETEVKRIMLEILKGMKYLHGERIIHRDLKCGNLLMNRRGEVKIVDFGLARVKSVDNLTEHVVTFWYRAPELLLGKSDYDEKIDIWSLGCIFAELLTNEVLFRGGDAHQQVACIYQRLGNPEATWPEISRLRWWNEYRPRQAYEPDLEASLKRRCNFVEPILLDLLKKMLDYNPAKRISAKDALNHPYFSSDPAPCSLRDLGNYQTEYHATMLNDKAVKKNLGDRPDLANKRFAEGGKALHGNGSIVPQIAGGYPNQDGLLQKRAHPYQSNRP